MVICSKGSGNNEESYLSINTTDDLEDTVDQESSTESWPNPKYTLQEDVYRDFLSCYSEDEDAKM